MSSNRIVLLLAALILLVYARFGMTADEAGLPAGTIIQFVAPVGTIVNAGDATVVFNGPPLGQVVVPGTCVAPAGSLGQLQSAASFRPGSPNNGPIGNVIVTHVNQNTDPAPIPAGTRLGAIEQLDVCGTTNDYQPYRGVVK